MCVVRVRAVGQGFLALIFTDRLKNSRNKKTNAPNEDETEKVEEKKRERYVWFRKY